MKDCTWKLDINANQSVGVIEVQGMRLLQDNALPTVQLLCRIIWRLKDSKLCRTPLTAQISHHVTCLNPLIKTCPMGKQIWNMHGCQKSASASSSTIPKSDCKDWIWRLNKCVDFKGDYSKTCVKRPLKNRQNKGLNDKW